LRQSGYRSWPLKFCSPHRLRIRMGFTEEEVQELLKAERKRVKGKRGKAKP
jgi:hypothetical protein